MKKTLPYCVLFSIGLVILFSGCFGYAASIKSYPFRSTTRYYPNDPPTGWKNMFIYYSEPDTTYEILASIRIDGGIHTEEKGLFRKLQQEAARYRADAIFVIDYLVTDRNTLNMFNGTLNIINSVNDPDYDSYYDLPIEGSYESLQVIGYAIRYKKETPPNVSGNQGVLPGEPLKQSNDAPSIPTERPLYPDSLPDFRLLLRTQLFLHDRQ